MIYPEKPIMSGTGITRREFVRGAAALAGAAMTCQAAGFALQARKTATDQVALGKTGMKLSRLGIGTGTISGSVQRGLGHDRFNALIRYAYDRGITYIDTSDTYQTHTWVREAIKGIPREKLYIQSKIPTTSGFGGRGGFGAAGRQASALETLDRFRRELDVDYIDTVLIHCQIAPDWVEQTKALQDGLEEARQKNIIRAHGVSCHSLAALKRAAELPWVDVNLVRINPQGVNMDTGGRMGFGMSGPADVSAVVEQLKVMRKKDHGIIGMKLIGQGQFRTVEERRKSLTWVLQSNLVDAVVVGMKSREEIDEAILHIDNAFAL